MKKILALSLLAAWTIPAQAGLLDALLGNDGGAPLPTNPLTADMQFDRAVKSEITLIVTTHDGAAKATVCDLAKTSDGRCLAAGNGKAGAEVLLFPYQLDDSRLKPGAATRVVVMASPQYSVGFSKSRIEDARDTAFTGTLKDLATKPFTRSIVSGQWGNVGSNSEKSVTVTVALGRPVR